MEPRSVRGCLDAAAESLAEAREAGLDEDAAAYVGGLIELMETFCEDGVAAAESPALPQSGALHTMMLRLDDLAESAEETAEARLRSAAEHLDTARLMMEDRLEEGRSPTNGARSG